MKNSEIEEESEPTPWEVLTEKVRLAVKRLSPEEKLARRAARSDMAAKHRQLVGIFQETMQGYKDPTCGPTNRSPLMQRLKRE